MKTSEALEILKGFISVSQLSAMHQGMKGEEGTFFEEKLVEMATLVQNMHKTYEQDGKGDQAIATLHYFKNGCDWFITEKDVETEQHQAFGLASIQCVELGYISIIELLHNDVELDLHFTPKTLEEIKKDLK